MLFNRWRSPLALLAAALICYFASGQAAAQYYGMPPPPPGVAPGYSPYGGYPGYGYVPYAGGYWQGAASAIDAYGNLGLDMEQARILREKANQAKLDTKVKSLDVAAYERANKYWFADEQVDVEGKKIQAAMNNPPMQEVISGRALNTLLSYLDRLTALGSRGPIVPLDPSVVRSINVSTGVDAGNSGLLREINSLQWPYATLGPNQKKLDDLLKQTTYEASSSRPSPTAINQLGKQTDIVQDEVKQKFYKSEIDGADYLAGNRFLDRVRQAIQALKQPNITSMLSGQICLQGSTVDQVVVNMTSKGMNFAAAQPGQEFAYVAMHRAFVNYGLACGSVDTGFRVRVGGGINVPVKK